jgi:hypothetical protein
LSRRRNATSRAPALQRAHARRARTLPPQRPVHAFPKPRAHRGVQTSSPATCRAPPRRSAALRVPPIRPLFRPLHARLSRLATVPRRKWSGIPSRRRHCPLPLARRDYKTALPFSCRAQASVALPSSLPWCAHPSSSFCRWPAPPAASLAPNRAHTAVCCPGQACSSPDSRPPRPPGPGSATQPRWRHHNPNSSHNEP